MPKATVRKMALSTQIFIALVLAIIAGIAFTGNPSFPVQYIKPFGTIFLNLIKWIVCPLVFFSIMSGIVSLRDVKKIGAIGGSTVLYYLCTTAFAVAIGLLFANLLKGVFPVLSTAELSYTPSSSGVNFMDTLVGIFPSNFIKPFVEANMLQIIVSALIIGFALILIGHRFNMEFKAVDVCNDICMKVMELILSACSALWWRKTDRPCSGPWPWSCWWPICAMSFICWSPIPSLSGCLENSVPSSSSAG